MSNPFSKITLFMITQSPYNFTFTASALRPEPVGIVAEKFPCAGSWDEAKRTMLAANALFRREFIHKLDAGLKHLGQVEAASTNAREETAVPKQADKLRKSLKECQEWEREVVLPLAQQRLGLDDGVKANYLKFPGFLAKIPGLETKEE